MTHDWTWVSIVFVLRMPYCSTGSLFQRLNVSSALLSCFHELKDFDMKRLFFKSAALTLLVMTAGVAGAQEAQPLATTQAVVSVTHANVHALTPDQFIADVAIVNENPAADANLAARPVLVSWLDHNPAVHIQANICPEISELAQPNSVDAVLLSELLLAQGVDILSHPQASQQEHESFALASALRLYLRLQSLGMSQSSAYADAALADVKANGTSSLARHTCAGTQDEPVAPTEAAGQ
jgi:hypothetical protein